MDEILNVVSQQTGISVENIKSTSRKRSVCEARQIFMYLARELYGCTFNSIGDFLNRSPPGIFSSLLDFDQSMRVYKGLRDRVENIERIILTKEQLEPKPERFPKIPYRKKH